jgi:cytochrome c biogenesis protein CcmG, thiol:disulfide interchange protein DsbE
MRRLWWIVGLVALVVVLVIGLRSAPRDKGDDVHSAAPSPAEVKRAFAGSPAPLARIHAQNDRIIGGGQKALTRQIRDLRGYPVVVNLWASWCVPCRSEFPIFQRTSVSLGRNVGFLGVLIQDKRPSAERFLKEFPLTYPSIDDAKRDIISELKAVGVPSTAFYDRRGKLAFLHQGTYRTEADLHRDIQRYLGVASAS